MNSSPKTDKVTRILIMYYQLANGQHINKELFSWEHGISERSFDRDIEDLRLFLSEMYSAREVQFEKETGTYFLTGDKPAFMERMEVAIIAKILIDSKMLRSDEMLGLYNSLMKVTSPKDAMSIKYYMKQDIDNYSSDTKSALLKTLGDLYVAIESDVDIEITLRSDTASPQRIQVSPLQIKAKDGRFVLVAATNMDLHCINYYAIEEINDFIRLKTFYARSLKQQYYQEENKI